jgi:site-specific recombinase XerD
MAKAMVVTYECEQCGTEVVVTETGETMLSPIYCCGMQVTEVSSVEKKPVKPKKKTVKKVAKKKVAKRKKPAAKKKASKK